MPASAFWFSGFRRSFSVPAGSLANASFVGAKTVKGPVPESVLARPAAFTAETNVEKSWLPEATSTTVFWACVAAGVVVADAAGVGDEPEDESLALLLDEQPASARAKPPA